eukprot:CAMPEP_0115856150 /NCGR_PEP_ID=MMETSP0287-20121206/14903_1 /TAXON_ID=412157 /ORGANISM="Chrysochromulina rotalis, Strain UIO044" /LENGTH=655 /DNA_ID=CAMNT_0003310313 /DNA_START=4 /DNA_END=1968 /DNA_ORIENTATION=+
MNMSFATLTDYASYAKNVAVTATTLVAGTELEKKMAEATSNEPWGASGTMLTEISRATFSYEDFKTIMAFTWKNLGLSGSLWRVVYKTLNMLDHMIRNGSDRVVEDARDHVREIKALQKFEFVDPEGKDSGVNVREKAKQIVELLGSDEQLNEARDKAKGARNRYTGVSAADMGISGGGSDAPKSDVKKGWSDDDFKFAADRGRSSSASQASLSSMMTGVFSTVTEYATAANKQIASMNTLFPSSDLDKKLGEATSNEPGQPSSSLLYELGRATHREDDYRIVTSQIWQTVLRSNQRPRVVLKTLMVLEAVLLHGPDRALEETIDMKTDIKALQTFSHADEGEAAKVQAKAKDILELLDDGSRLHERRAAAQSEFTDGSESHYTRKSKQPSYDGFGSESSPKGKPAKSKFDDDGGFGAAFDTSPAPAPAAPAADLFSFDSPSPVTATAAAAPAAPSASEAPTAPAAVSSLTGNIGKIQIKGREKDESERRAPRGGSVSLGALPTPALPAAPKAPASACMPSAPAGNAADDLLGLMDVPSAPPAAPLMGGGGDPFGTAVPPAVAAPPPGFGGGMDDAFGDFDSAPAPPPPAEAPPAAPPKSAMDSLLESSLSGFDMGGAPPAAAAPAPAATKVGMAQMGSGASGMGGMGAPMGGMG